MRNAWKIFYAVAGGLVAAGLVVALGGFVTSGFDARVFTAQVDRGQVTLGGTRVDNPASLPLFLEVLLAGSIEIAGN